MTVRPLLQGARDWCPPAGVQAIFGAAHFAQRAEERGVRTLPGYLLLWVVKEALDRGRDDLVGRVYAVTDRTDLYRILLPEGPFYPLIRDGVPVTIYGPFEKRKLQRARRLRKRSTGKRVRILVPE